MTIRKCTWEVPVYKIIDLDTGLKVKIDYTVVEGNVDSDYVYTSPSNGKAVSGNGSDYEMKTWNATQHLVQQLLQTLLNQVLNKVSYQK